MPTENNAPKPWRRFTASATPPPRNPSYRLAFRLLGLPILAVAAVYLYNGLRDYMVLPECDSERAKRSLAELLGQLKLEPLRYEPIKTISSSRDRVECNAVMPLPDGGNVAVDYTFYWQGNKANMRYSITRKSS